MTTVLVTAANLGVVVATFATIIYVLTRREP